MNSVFIKNLLAPLGYSEEHFSENYFVQIDGTSAIKFDYVAFSDIYLKDISTSCIAIQEVEDDTEEEYYVEGARYLAAPVVIVSRKDQIRIWNIASSEKRLLRESDEKILPLYFEENRFEFMSDHLLEAKMGYRQLDIFEAVGLIDFSREATCKMLREEFEHGLNAAKKYLSARQKVSQRDLNRITSIVMHVIAALIINSKMNQDQGVADLSVLLNELSHRYQEYFSDGLMLRYGSGMLDAIYESLTRSINYQSVDHELLGYFYESTLLQFDDKKARDIRKEYGIFYTPGMLSREIASSIPFECIPPEKRYVLDGTCGSGSLLLSACKRLEELARYQTSSGFERHDYLTKMIQGYDVDKFASEVARLSLLLYSLPYGNQWNIKAGNLLLLDSSVLKKPYVIMANPPFEDTRKDQRKQQKAMGFLQKYLEWLEADGYIGIILPASFLQNESCKEQRRQLLYEFDLLEVWELPGQIFQNNCSTIVIIAQKKACAGNELTKIKILGNHRHSAEQYLRRRKWDFSFFEKIQDRWKRNPDSRMTISPVDDVLLRIVENRETLDDITRNITGIHFPSNYPLPAEPMDGGVPYILNARHFRRYVMSEKMHRSIKYLRYHMAKEEEERIKEEYRYPGLRLRKKYEDIYTAPNKVLVKMTSTPGKIHCLDALVDEEGCIPSHSFFVVVADHEQISNYVLCALLNSKLINAFVRNKCAKRTITTTDIREIPIPAFCDAQTEELERCCRDMKEAYQSEDEAMADHIQERMDQIIYDAFGVPEQERKKITRLFEGYEGACNDGGLPAAPPKRYRNVTGQVERIDTDRMYCHLISVELGEQEIEISASMPGWFLREGAEFSAKYAEGKLYDIRPLVYSYLSEDGIDRILEEAFHG